MILWVNRGAAVLNGIFLVALLFPAGNPWAAIAGGILNLTWTMAPLFPSMLRRLLPASLLVINTLMAIYGVLSGGPAVFALLAAGGSLISWNTGLFARRWPDPAPMVQYRYFRRLGKTTVLGVGAGLSALVFRGQFPLPFPLAFLALAIAGGLYLQLLSRGIREERRGKKW
jgi:hypothetical protein